jgi:hypothetical protein
MRECLEEQSKAFDNARDPNRNKAPTSGYCRIIGNQFCGKELSYPRPGSEDTEIEASRWPLQDEGLRRHSNDAGCRRLLPRHTAQKNGRIKNRSRMPTIRTAVRTGSPKLCSLKFSAWLTCTIGPRTAEWLRESHILPTGGCLSISALSVRRRHLAQDKHHLRGQRKTSHIL